MNTAELKQKIIKHIQSRLNDLIPNTPMLALYEKTINNMSDRELESWIQALENGVLDEPDLNKPYTTITLIVPPLDPSNSLDIGRIKKLTDKMGYNFMERCWLTNDVTGQTTLTNRRYAHLLLPVRRQAQTLDNKISLPEGDKIVDDLTGQVTGDSKGASLSYPEIQMLDAQGLDNVILELIKTRGGDEDALRLMKRRLLETGEVQQEEIDQLDSRAKVNETTRHILAGMHIKSNL
nr:MAG TPA: hypothetical protein [Caudoviricetes sp.]